MNLNNAIQIDKDCYSIKQKNDLKDLNYIVNTGSHVHCLENDNTYVYLGENRWGLIENKDSGSSEGSDLITETLQVTANGIYEAPEGKAYNQVEVEVPNGRLDYIVSWDDSAYDVGNNSVAITSYYPANGMDDILNPVLDLTIDDSVRTYNLTAQEYDDEDINGERIKEIHFKIDNISLSEPTIAVLYYDINGIGDHGRALSCKALSTLVSGTVTEASITWHRFGEIDVSPAMIKADRIDVSIKAGSQQTIWYTNAYAAPDYAYLDTFNFQNPLDVSTTVPMYRYSAKVLPSRGICQFAIVDPIDILNPSNLLFNTFIGFTTPSDIDPSLDYLDGLCSVLIIHDTSGEGPRDVPIGLNVHTADQQHFNSTGLYLISPSTLITMIRSQPGFDPTDQSSELVMMVNALQQFGYSVVTIDIVSLDEQTLNDTLGASIMYQGILPDMVDGMYLYETTVFDTTIKREDVPQATAYSLQASENPASAGLDSIRFRLPEVGNVPFYRYSDWYTSSLEEAEQHGFKLLGAYVVGQDPDLNDGVSQVEYPLILIKPSDAGVSAFFDPYLLGIAAIVNNNTIPIGVIMFEQYGDLDGNIFKKGIYLMAPEALNSMGMFGSGDYEIEMIRAGQPGEIAADSQVALTSYYYVHDILGDSHFTGYMSVMDISFPKSHFTVADEGKVVNNGALVAQTAHATVTQNGTIDTTLNNSITVNVPASTPVLQQLVVSENGTYTPDPGMDGFDEVIVMVDGDGESVLETLTVTENGTYTPDPGVDGFDEVVVEVDGSGGSVLVASKTVVDGYVTYTFNTNVVDYVVGAIPSELHNLQINISFNPSIPIAMIADDTATLTIGQFGGQGYRFATSSISADRFPSAIYAFPVE